MSEYVEYQLVPKTKTPNQSSATLWLPTTVGFSPGRPISPMAPSETPRRYQYLAGRNMLINPDQQDNHVVTYKQMRQLANVYGILRTVIEQRKDEMKGLDWQIAIREEFADQDLEIERRKAQRFFERPDGEHTFDQWLGMLLEDLFVTDTACLYKERTYRGKFTNLQVMDGTTIICLVDDSGRIPPPPEMAYQQRIWGMPRTSYMKPVRNDITNAYELYYRPYNTVSHSVYGFSHVESILFTINIALRKDVMSLNHFTDGNIPRGILNLADEALKTWTEPNQIVELQEHVDTLLAGNDPNRSKMVILPGVNGVQLLDNQVPFDGVFEEWLARVVCARFGVSPAPYTHMTNRATAETMEEARQESALIPMTQHFKAWFDEILDVDLNMPYLEFVWDKGANYDQEQANMDLEMLHNGVKTIDDLRTAQGLKPLEDGYGSHHYIWTGAGILPVEDLQDIAESQSQQLNNYSIPPLNDFVSLSASNDLPDHSNDSAMSSLSPKAIDELKAWRKFELTRVGRRKTREFETKEIPESLRKRLVRALQNAKTAEDIKKVFNPLTSTPKKPKTELDQVIENFQREFRAEIDAYLKDGAEHEDIERAVV